MKPATRKTNGQARPKSKTPRPREKKKAAKKFHSFSVHMIPFHGELSPARARRWMKDEFPAFASLAHECLGRVEDQKDRSAFSWFAHSVECMVTACVTAIESGKPVTVSSELEPPTGDERARFTEIEAAVRVLRLPSIAPGELIETFGESELAAFGALAGAVYSYVERGQAIELKSSRDAVRRQRDAEDPEKRQERALDRQDRIRELRKAVKSEQEAVLGEVEEELEVAVERIVAKARAPFKRRLAYLQYEDDLIYHEHAGLEHPGKSPEGYAPVTGQATP